MGNMAVHFSSVTAEWETPQDFFDSLCEEFPFRLDVAATEQNAKCRYHFTIQDDALKIDWHKFDGPAWMNPPYGREIGKWVKKAYEESQKGITVVCLLPARTDTAWWHDYVMRGEIRYIRGRLKFGGHKNSAPFPSAIVIFRRAGEG